MSDSLPVATNQRIALGVEYDGGKFHGWQTQSGQVRTVQGALQQALSAVADRSITVACAGRTDTGVHSAGQVVHFDAPVKRPLLAWTMGVNSQLPEDVSVRWASSVVGDFHARFSATGRRYRYRISNTRLRSALSRGFATWVRSPLDAQMMHDAGQTLLGERDFNAFRAASCQSRSSWRNLEELTVRRCGLEILIDVEANAFLHHMVRNLVGVLIAVGAGEKSPDWPAQVLASRDRRAGGITAPPQGLSLLKVRYPARFSLPDESA